LEESGSNAKVYQIDVMFLPFIDDKLRQDIVKVAVEP